MEVTCMWKTFSIKQIGTSHKQNNTCCQDDVRIREDEQWIVAALADGLGSLSHSELAAEIATQTLCGFPHTLLEKIINNDAGIEEYIVETVADAIKAEADSRNIDYTACDCTLVFVVIDKLRNLATVGRLGDSAAIILRKTDSVVISDSDHSANGTNAVLDSEAFHNLNLISFKIEDEDIIGFILTSDGLDNELYLKGSRHVQRIAGLYFNAVSVSKGEKDSKIIIQNRLAKLTDVPESSYDDDISIAILSRIDYPVEMPEDPTWLCSCGARNYLQETYCHKCRKDFSILYQNIRFREHGGKDAFFSKINKEPDEERRIVGLPPIKSETTPQSQIVNPVQKPSSNPPAAKISTADSHNDSSTIKEKSSMSASSAELNLPPITAGNRQNNSKSNKPIKTSSSGHVSIKKAFNKKGVKSNKRLRIPRVLTRLFPLLLCLVVGLLMGIILKSALSSKKISNLNSQIKSLEDEVCELSSELNTKDNAKDTVAPSVTPSIEPTSVPTSLPTETPDQTTEPYIILSDGSYYWGPVTAGIPDGFGMQLIGDKYYIGLFNMGLKNGEFTIVDLDDDNHIETDRYKNGILIPTTSPSPSDEPNPSTSPEQSTVSPPQETTSPVYNQYILTQSVRLREEPGISGRVIRLLETGTTVELVDTVVVNKDDYDWVWVKLSDGAVGWIIKSAIDIH